MLLLLLFFFSLFFTYSIVFYTFKYGISPMPTNFKVRKCFIENTPKNFLGTFLDLGSGWGHIIFTFAKKNPQSQVIGYEISLIPYLYSKLVKIIFGYKNVRIIRKDFFKISFEGAEIIYCYLYVDAMNQLETKMKNEKMIDKRIVISNTFTFPNLKPNKTICVNDMHVTKMYFYAQKT